MDHYHPTDLPNVCSLDDFIKLGQDYGKKHPDQFEDAITASQPDDLISFTYTSGTTGNPKAGMYTSRNIISCARVLPKAISVTRGLIFYVLLFCPMAHIAERLVGTLLSVLFYRPSGGIRRKYRGYAPKYPFKQVQRLYLVPPGCGKNFMPKS